jgi:Ethanolamine utilization protein EutJ (predicted chaperonin)
VSKDDNQYFIDGKRVDRQTWLRHRQESDRKLIHELRTRNEELRRLQAKRNELVHNVSTSGITALLESGKADPVAVFTEWAKTEFPAVVTQSYVDALTIFDERKEKKENALPNRFKKAFWYIVGSVVTVVLGAIALYYIALAGFKI